MSKQVKCTATNDFHNTSVSFLVPAGGGTLTRSQTKRIFRTLCGMADCCCGGIRGPQNGMPEHLDIGDTDNKDCLEIVRRETREEWMAMHAENDAKYETRGAV